MGNHEIFMGLKDGTFRSLLLGPKCFQTFSHAKGMNHDMLKALDYLAVRGIIHGDLEPENILYTLRDDRLEFQLADLTSIR
jgi:serine/threonine protein kinase